MWTMNAFKSLLFLILAAGIGAGYVPFIVLPAYPQVETGLFAYVAFPLWLVGGVTILWCFWNFTFQGHGTPAPIDPPKELVVTGLYHYVRNPIYLGVLTIITADFLWFKTIWMVVYAVAVFLLCHLFVTLYEEPALKRKFGALYEMYCQSVPRWVPRFK